MKADDIRKITLPFDAQGESTEGSRSEYLCLMLQEIAAQLAELNERLDLRNQSEQ